MTLANNSLTGGTFPTVIVTTLTEGSAALVGMDQGATPISITAQNQGPLATLQTSVPSVTRAGLGTQVNAGAVLEVNMSGQTINEPLNLQSVGFGNLPTGGLKILDAPGTAVNHWTGQITLGGTNIPSAISVVGADDTLDQGGTGFITSTQFLITNTGTVGNNLLKLGQGTLELGGTSSNNYNGSTYLNEGTLSLNKKDVGLNEVQTLAFGGTAGKRLGNAVVRRRLGHLGTHGDR